MRRQNVSDILLILVALVLVAAVLGTSVRVRDMFTLMIPSAIDLERTCTVASAGGGGGGASVYKMDGFPGLVEHPSENNACFFSEAAGYGLLRATKNCASLGDRDVVISTRVEPVLGSERCVVRFNPNRAPSSYAAYENKLQDVAIEASDTYSKMASNLNSARQTVDGAVAKRDGATMLLDKQITLRRSQQDSMNAEFGKLENAMLANIQNSANAVGLVKNINDTKSTLRSTQERVSSKTAMLDGATRTLASQSDPSAAKLKLATMQSTLNSDDAQFNDLQRQLGNVDADLKQTSVLSSKVDTARVTANAACAARDVRMRMRQTAAMSTTTSETARLTKEVGRTQFTFYHPDGRVWRYDDGADVIRLNSGRPITLVASTMPGMYASSDGRIGFVDVATGKLVRHAWLWLRLSSFEPNNYDFAWQPIADAGKYRIYNDYDGGYYISYDDGQDAVLIVRKTDPRASMTWTLGKSDIEFGIDYPYNDIGFFTIPSLDDCIKTCVERPECAAAVFAPSIKGCWHKSIKGWRETNLDRHTWTKPGGDCRTKLVKRFGDAIPLPYEGRTDCNEACTLFAHNNGCAGMLMGSSKSGRCECVGTIFNGIELTDGGPGWFAVYTKQFGKWGRFLSLIETAKYFTVDDGVTRYKFLSGSRKIYADGTKEIIIYTPSTPEIAPWSRHDFKMYS